MELTSREYWQTSLDHTHFERGFAFFDDIARHLPDGRGQSFLEIGCAPGRILAEFSLRKGYEAHGIDYATSAAEIEEYLRTEGATVGEIAQADFLTWKPGRQYDVVASFGFIEHFEDPADIVARHFALTKPGGYVVLEMPNFARGQKLLNSVFNPQTIKACNTSCMNLRFFEKVAAAHNARLLDARFVGGGFSFFIRDEPRPLLWQRILWRTEKPWEWLSKQFPNSVNSWFSPYMIGVFQVPGEREA